MKTMNSTLALLLILFTGSILNAQESGTPPVRLEKIGSNVYQINGGQGANGGMIIGEKDVLIIDSKMTEESVRQTFDAISDLTDNTIRYLVNTHSDGDHIMGNRYFSPSVIFIAQVNCRDDFFQSDFGRESDWGQPEYFPFTPSITFEDRMQIWLGREKIELYYFGAGHTSGDLVVFIPDKRIAFIGDLYFSGRPQLIHSIKNGNTFAYVQTMNRMLATLDAEIFCSGHSEPVGREDIKTHIQAMVDMQNQVKELVKEGRSLEDVLGEYDESEARLVTSIYSEVTEQDPIQSTENPY